MNIEIDPPLWPAHRTLWSHLVSTQSLAQLHGFAFAQGIPARAFDGDHYDVPAEQHDELVAAGALPVPAHQLVRDLRASGLRLTAGVRVRRLTDLRTRWATLAPTGEVGPSAGDLGSNKGESWAMAESWARVGEELLVRWRERGRLHHGLPHLVEVLEAIDRLASAEQLSEADLRRARLAAWFHDAVHSSGLSAAAREAHNAEPKHPSDEAASADLVRNLLPTDPDADRVAALVLMTQTHQSAPGDLAAAVLSDADLSVLGSSPQRYADYAAAIRAEYAHIPDSHFRPGRATILEALVAGELFATPSGNQWWDAAARANLTAEISALRVVPSAAPNVPADGED